MTRALILIGVAKIASLTELHAVSRSIARVRSWATATQQIPEANIVEFNDAAGPVRVSDIANAIKSLAARGNVEQLLIYFTGHGFVNNLTEYWLLSGAPDDGNAAVNVSRSLELARRSVFGHIVVVSDACRLPADATLQFQSVSGSDIFPNTRGGKHSRPVDVFYASLVGDPAYEVLTQGMWRGAYTEVFTNCLHGDPSSLLTKDPTSDVHALVKPWPLKEYLDKQIIEPGQEPDANVSSGGHSWISRLERSYGPTDAPPTRHVDSSRRASSAATDRTITTRELLFLACAQPDARAFDHLSVMADRAFGEVFERRERITSLDVRLGRPGFAVFGGFAKFELLRRLQIRSAEEIGNSNNGLFRQFAFDFLGDSIVEILLEFEPDRGMLLPVLPGFVAVVLYRDRRVDHVSYISIRKSEDESIWSYSDALVDVNLEAVASTAANFGLLQSWNKEYLVRRITGVAARSGRALTPSLQLLMFGQSSIRDFDVTIAAHNHLPYLRHRFDQVSAELSDEGVVSFEEELLRTRSYTVSSTWTVYNSIGLARLRSLAGPILEWDSGIVDDAGESGMVA